MAGDSESATDRSAAEGEAAQKPGKSFSNSALIALLSSLLAVVVPVTTAIVEHYEKEKELALKDKELEQNITLECLKLAVSKDTPPADRRRVLQAIVGFNTPLKQWALDGVSEIDKESEAAQERTQSVQSSFDSRGKAPVGLVVLKNKEAILQQRISRESQNGDAGAADSDLEALLLVKSQEVAFAAVPVEAPVNGAKSTHPDVNQAALDASGSKSIPIKEADVTVEIVQKMFPGTPTADINVNLPLVLNALKQFGILDRTMVLVALSTIRAEVGSFKPLEEREDRFNTSPGGHPFDLYDDRRALGNRGAPDGARFKGRGFILVTGRANYTRMSADMGLGTALVDAPDKASDPKIAAQLLALYLQQRVVKFKQAASENDLAQMRKLETGGASGLNAFTAAYQTGDKLLPK